MSLLPSATEIVYALGLGDQLVGVTFECGSAGGRARSAGAGCGRADDQAGRTVRPHLCHPGLSGQDAQNLHYEQAIYPLPRDRDVMVTAIWALDDFTAANGATVVIPGSYQLLGGKPGTSTS